MEIKLGPVMPEEGDLLATLVNMLRPNTVVEFGFQDGVSTRYLLKNINAGWVYSFDPSPRDDSWIGPDDNVTLYRKGQETICAQDTAYSKVDMVFFDGAHELKLNIAAFNALKPLLSDNAILVVHDTGLWRTDLFDAPGFGHLVAPNLRAHQPHEIAFVEWLKVQGLQRIDLTPTHVVRHGLTILQWKKDL